MEEKCKRVENKKLSKMEWKRIRCERHGLVGGRSGEKRRSVRIRHEEREKWRKRRRDQESMRRQR